MRATRAYLAGFGTSGSLLAGAALMFVLASAFVAFHGWPQVAGQTAPVSVSIPPSDVAAASPASRVLTGTVARHARATAPAAPVRHRARGVTVGAPGSHTAFRVHHASGQTSITRVSRDPGTGHTPGGSTTGSSSQTCTSGCGPSSGPVGSVQHTVSGAGSSAGSTAGSTVTTVKKIIKSVTPSASAVSNAGSTVGNVVTTTKKVVTGLTHGHGLP